MKPVPNTLKKYTIKDPEFVMEVIEYILDKHQSKSTSVISKVSIFKLLSLLEEISTPAMRELYPDLTERSVRFKTAMCRKCIKAVS